MENKLKVTISDYKGSKHYIVHKRIKKIILWILLTIFLTLSFSFKNIHFLKAQLQDYNKLQVVNYELEKNLQDKSMLLENTLNEKTLELEILNKKIQDIEDLIAMKHDKDLLYSERLDLAQLNIKTKNYILSMIPNGHVVSPYNGITSSFGTRVDPITKRSATHNGIDYRASIGTDVIAPSHGIVEFSGTHSGFGKMIIINHNYGFKTLYAHLSKQNFKVGDHIKKGDIIGQTGNTGRSTGPHLHYEVHYLGIKLNPINFINWNLKNYSDIFKKESKIQWQSLIEIMEKNQQI